jgi:hypothetical protein
MVFDDERPTNRGGTRSNIDHTVGQLMVESLNHRRRIEILEERLADLEDTKKNSAPASGGSLTPDSKSRLFHLIRKTVTITALSIAAVITTLKELGLLK